MPKGATTRPARVAPVYQLLSVTGPTAGVDLRSAPTLLATDRARSLINFSLTEPGALVVRAGYTQFSTGSLNSAPIQGGSRVYFNTAIPSVVSTAVTLVAADGGIYLQTDSGGWVSTVAAATGYSTSLPIRFTSDRDLVAAFDGVTTAQKSTNGSSWTRFGILAGSAGPTVSTLSTGGLSSGEYEFAYTYKSRGLATESNGSSNASTLTLSASSGAVNVVVPNSTDPQVQAIKVYGRKVSAGESVRRYISSLAQSAGASSTLVVTSTAWTTNDEEPNDHDAPGVLAFGAVWKNRWWAKDGTVSNRIRFTQLFQPQSWPALFYIDVPFERGDSIQALVPLGDSLIIFGTSRAFAIIGATSLDFEVRPTLGSQDGAFGPSAVLVVENGVLHAGASGLYNFDGSQDKLLSFDLDPAWRDLVQNVAASNLAKTALVYHQRFKEVRLSVPRRYPSGAPGEWVLDLNRTRTTGQPAWTATDRNIGGYIAWDGPEVAAGDRGRVLTWHSSLPRLFEEGVGTDGNSSNIRAEYEGPGLSLGPNRGRWIDIRGEYEPHAGNASVDVVVDGVAMGSQTLAIGASGAEYGTAEYGVDDYAGGENRRQWFRLLPLRASGRTAVVKLVYEGQEAWRVYAYHLGMVPETAPREFSE